MHAKCIRVQHMQGFRQIGLTLLEEPPSRSGCWHTAQASSSEGIVARVGPGAVVEDAHGESSRALVARRRPFEGTGETNMCATTMRQCTSLKGAAIHCPMTNRQNSSRAWYHIWPCEAAVAQSHQRLKRANFSKHVVHMVRGLPGANLPIGRHSSARFIHLPRGIAKCQWERRQTSPQVGRLKASQ